VKKDYESLIQHIWSLPQIERVARQQNIQGSKLPIVMELLSVVDDRLEYLSEQVHRRSVKEEEKTTMPPKAPLLQNKPKAQTLFADPSRNAASLRNSNSYSKDQQPLSTRKPES
jgi:hypothetical protein